MKINGIALLSGILFGFGLCLSEMINPEVVIGFLDIFGEWNPALIFVMLGALLVTIIAFRFVLSSSKPLCSSAFSLPQKRDMDKPLVLGSILFGLGWGLVGICPGPAIAALALALPKAICFAFFMMIGTGMYHLFQGKI